jgi:hypothetical protein
MVHHDRRVLELAAEALELRGHLVEAFKDAGGKLGSGGGHEGRNDSARIPKSLSRKRNSTGTRIILPHD